MMVSFNFFSDSVLMRSPRRGSYDEPAGTHGWIEGSRHVNLPELALKERKSLMVGGEQS